jgi:hypothetical protein
MKPFGKLSPELFEGRRKVMKESGKNAGKLRSAKTPNHSALKDPHIESTGSSK